MQIKQELSVNQTAKVLERAENHFYRGEYREALRIYGILLKDHPNLKEARIGAILSDIAIENDEEAQAIFEYYQVLKKDENENAEAIVEEMIGSLDDAFEAISQFFEEALTGGDEPENGITYTDFVRLVELRGSFRRAFEDIMFSTKVIITEKEDLIDFIDRLMAHGFHEMAARYIEGAALAFPGEDRIRSLLERLKGGE